MNRVHDYEAVAALYATHTFTQIQEKLGFKTRSQVSGLVARAREAGYIQGFKVTKPSPEEAARWAEERKAKARAKRAEWAAKNPGYHKKRRAKVRAEKTALHEQGMPKRVYAPATGRRPRPHPVIGEHIPHTGHLKPLFERAKARKAAAPPEPASRNLTVAQITDRLCHWFHGDPKRTPAGYCGHPTDGSAYCACHHAMLYRSE